jgi:hypothetical protein
MEWYVPGNFVPEISMSAGYFALGGNKQSRSADPVFWCKLSDPQENAVSYSSLFLVNDIFMALSLTSFSGSESGGNFSAFAFAYITARNDSLKLDPSIGSPVQYNLRAQTWSFVNNDTKSKLPMRGKGFSLTNFLCVQMHLLRT